MTTSKTTFGAVLADLDRTLATVKSLGVPWEKTRFAEYRRTLEWANGWTLPKAIAPDEVEKDQILTEGLGQAQQLNLAAGFWAHLDQKLLVQMLKKKIFAGLPLPPTDPAADDLPRNTLLELTTARYLHTVGYKVQLTNQREDVLAQGGGYEFSVECKRPTSKASLRQNLTRIKEQLLARRDPARPRIGHAVIALDRVLEIGPGAEVETLAHAQDGLTELIRQCCADLTQLSQLTGLDKVATLGSVVLTAPVWVQSERCTYTLERAQVFAMNEEPATLLVLEAIRPLHTKR